MLVLVQGACVLASVVSRACVIALEPNVSNEYRKELTCRTDLNALAAVAITAAAKPARLKEGSPPVAMTMPITTGSKAAYVRPDSRESSIRRLRAAVKAGVVAPTACSTGIVFRT